MFGLWMVLRRGLRRLSDQASSVDEAASDLGEVAWRIGTLGFSYPDWAGVFYPRGVSGAERLTWYASRFGAIELDTTFHAVPTAGRVRRWAERVPEAFVFTLKAPRELTHGPVDSAGRTASCAPMGHLSSAGARGVLDRFMGAALELGPKLGMVVLQFPGGFAVERAGELGSLLAAASERWAGVRWAVELRHDSWWVPATAAMLRPLGVTWVSGDEVKKDEAGRAPRAGCGMYVPRPIVVTSDTVYVRWIGWHNQFEDLSRERVDATERLAWWRERLRAVIARSPGVRRVLGFFGNGFSGFAPVSADRMLGLLGLMGRGASSEGGGLEGGLFGR